jgi:hypothetical protein
MPRTATRPRTGTATAAATTAPPRAARAARATTSTGKPKAPPTPQQRLKELVGGCATETLDNGVALTPTALANQVRGAHAKLVEEVAKSNADKLVRAMARSCLRLRSDAPLQQELDLGLPEEWVLRVRTSGSVTYVLAADASEDDLIGAEEERRHQLKRAEARAANGQASGQRSVATARANLERCVELLQRLGRNGAA